MLKFLVFKSFRNRKFISFLCITSIALSLSLFLVVEKMRKGIESSFTNSISNADLIVGGRSSSLQLILYSIFHLGDPTSNISIQSYNLIKNHPMVKWTIPISLGDSYKGYRVVATNHNFYKHYQFHGDERLRLKKGTWSNKTFEVVMGSQVAKKTKHKIFDSIILTHGLANSGLLEHDNNPFKVVGILEPTGTPIDKSLYISLEGMEAIHLGHGADDVDNLVPTQITSFILRTKNRISVLGLQRFIANYDKEALTAVIPAMGLTSLWKILDQLEYVFLSISLFVVIIGFLTILISLYMSLNARQREIAILRSIGATPMKITSLLILEATFLSTLGSIIGFVLQYCLLFFLNIYLEAKYAILISLNKPSSFEFIVLISSIFFGSIFGLIPAVKAYMSSLNSELQIK